MSTISAGTTSTTTLVHSGDTTGSLVFKTNDTGSGGTTAVTIDTSQNLLVGTTSATFTYTGSSTATAKQVISTSGYDCINLISTGANPGIDFSQPNSASTIYRYANITGVMTTTTAGSESGALTFATGNAGANSAERMRIDSSGNLLVGCTGNFGAKQNIQFDPASTNGLLFAVSSGTFTNNYIYFQNSGGSKIGSVSSNNSSVTYNTTSDYRIKTNVQPMVGALNNVMQLNPVTYDWKPEFAEGRSQGFIAHELQAVVPDAVTGDKDAVDADGNPVYQGIDTSFLVATLTAAIKELKAINDQQAETINALTARVVALEGK